MAGDRTVIVELTEILTSGTVVVSLLPAHIFSRYFVLF